MLCETAFTPHSDTGKTWNHYSSPFPISSHPERPATDPQIGFGQNLPTRAYLNLSSSGT